MNNNDKLPGVFADISFDKNNKKQFTELDKSEVKLPVTDQSPHIKFYFSSAFIHVTVKLFKPHVFVIFLNIPR